MQALDCPSFFSPAVGSVPMAGIFLLFPYPQRGGCAEGA